MKHTLLSLSLILSLYNAQAQFFPGTFYSSVGNYYDTIGTSPCIVDSSFYIIRYGGVQTMTADSAHRTRYLWDRFYQASIIRKGPGSSLILLKSNKIYQYFPTQDSMICISATIPSPAIRDISASESCIWAITNFNEIGKYDSSGWHIITLPMSYDPNHILAISDTAAYLGDVMSVHIYSSSGLSNAIYIANTVYNLHDWVQDTAHNLWMSYDDILVKIPLTGGSTAFTNSSVGFLTSGEAFTHVATDNAGNIWTCTNSNKLLKYDGQFWSAPAPISTYPISAIAGDRFSDKVYVLGIENLALYSANSTRNYNFGNMPYLNAKAISNDLIATDQGIFTYNTSNYQPTLAPTDFKDTSTTPFANDVTCFVSNDLSVGSASSPGYGTMVFFKPRHR